MIPAASPPIPRSAPSSAMPCLGHAVHLAADGGDPGNQRAHRPGHRRRHRRQYPRALPPPLLLVIVALLLAANTINLGADLGAMGAALQLLIARSGGVSTSCCSPLSAQCSRFFRAIESYVKILKWTALSLFSYVATALAVDVPWGKVAYHTLVPELVGSRIIWSSSSPCSARRSAPICFFWQASEEAEDERIDRSSTSADRGARGSAGADPAGSRSTPISAWDCPT